MALGGFTLLLLGLGAAITLILDVAPDTMFAPLLAVPIVIFFAAVWYLYPRRRR